MLRPSVHRLPATGWCGAGLPPFLTACWWLTHPAAITGVPLPPDGTVLVDVVDCLFRFFAIPQCRVHDANSLQVRSQATVSCSQPEYSGLLMSCEIVDWVSIGVVVSSGSFIFITDTLLLLFFFLTMQSYLFLSFSLGTVFRGDHCGSAILTGQTNNSSVFPAISLGFTIWVRLFANVTVFLNPAIEVVTFRLRGWCVLGMFCCWHSPVKDMNVRERETDRQTDRQTERHRETGRDRQTDQDRETDSQPERQTERDRDRERDRQTENE